MNLPLIILLESSQVCVSIFDDYGLSSLGSALQIFTLLEQPITVIIILIIFIIKWVSTAYMGFPFLF